ncbi:MAG: lipoate--protein ligase, partial [Candidatus Izemoplasmatales bacterium]|nr:lipoate--protein ligase [Candidatus Izemoplasmatales bacterium]
HYPKDEYFFMWQVQPTVIFGRNQLIENEVNLEFVKENKIQYYRRKSGGGCVFADFSNIMFSFVTPHFNKDFVFDSYLTRVVNILKGLGLNAEFSGRNDILVDGLKVSGNAFYQVNNRSVVHGTMLFDTDMSLLIRSITPSNEKLISKGIDSVRKRVTNLKEHLSIDIEEFKQVMKNQIADDQITLTSHDMEEIAKIEETYLKEEFIYGKNPKYTVIKKGRTEAGTIEIAFELKNNVVKNVNILGDYFVLGDIEIPLRHLEGIQATLSSFQNALKEVEMKDYIMNFTTLDFLQIIFDNKEFMI